MKSPYTQQITIELQCEQSTILGTWNGVVTKWTNPLPSGGYSLVKGSYTMKAQGVLRTMTRKPP